MKTKRILCVCDGEDVRARLAGWLGREDSRFISARGADEALRLASAERFDLYVVVEQPASRAGVELCGRLRARDPRTPVLLCAADLFETPRADGGDASRARRAPARARSSRPRAARSA
ncbi:MAG TPA: response regulator [Pyrinomonadaceae bacterium]|jgi:DNA-binding response OmpR family regulator